MHKEQVTDDPMDPVTYPAVPHLETPNQGPLRALEAHLLDNQTAIETWLRGAWLQSPPPFYASTDLRNAGFKLAPVDTNLFPAGFNNLSPAVLPLGIQAVQAAMDRICPTARGILLIPENHTRNTFYLESLAALRDILVKAGYLVRIGSMRPDLTEVETLELPTGATVELFPLVREGDLLRAGDFEPCVILLNNDLSSGRPPLLEGLLTPIVPHPSLGWSDRLKSEHFSRYSEVAQELARLVDIDPWLIDPLFKNCGSIDFLKREGEDCLADNVQALLSAIGNKYREYKIDQRPYVVIKGDRGTYGMGIMIVHSADEVRGLNRKQRNKMASAKDGQSVNRVLLQEGVHTLETWEDAVAEPVIYMIDRFVVGGFYRVHKSRGANENLNSPGMHFEPLAFADPCNNPDQAEDPDARPNRFYAYGVIARLAMLAASRELSSRPQTSEQPASARDTVSP